jgi:hypothetical protein
MSENLKSQQPPQSQKISVGKAILIGQLVINLPVLMIFLGVSGTGIFLILLFFTSLHSLQGWPIFFALIPPILMSGALAWLWWSFFVPRWRRWAIQNGAPADKLQKWAVVTGLVWRKGSLFEKTEFRLKD